MHWNELRAVWFSWFCLFWSRFIALFVLWSLLAGFFLVWFSFLCGFFFCVASWFLDVLSLLSWFIGQALHWSSFCDFLTLSLSFLYKPVFVQGCHWISFKFSFNILPPHCFCFVTLLMWVAYVWPTDIFSFALLHYSYKMWYILIW